MSATRHGRDLELLVGIIEEALAGDAVHVRSPEFIKGADSLETREVDVSLRCNVGSAPIFVMIECRDRKKKADVLWIEQLASKRKDVGATSAVAVSSSGFTKGALATAQRRGIETRTLQEIELTDLFSWIGLSEINVVESPVSLVTFKVMVPRDEYMEPLTAPDLVLVDERSGQALSPTEVLRKHIHRAPPYTHAIPTGRSSLETELRVPLSETERSYRIDGFATEVLGFKFRFMIDFNRFLVPLSRLSSYTGEKDSLAETAEFSFQLSGKDFTFSLHRLLEAQKIIASMRAK